MSILCVHILVEYVYKSIFFHENMSNSSTCTRIYELARVYARTHVGTH